MATNVPLPVLVYSYSDDAARAGGAILSDVQRGQPLPYDWPCESCQALAREVEGLKAKLKIWHDSDDDIMDKHGVDTDGYIKQLERQVTKAQANLEAEEQRGFDRIKERDEAQQRIEMISNAHNIVVDNLEQAEQRVKELEARLAKRDEECNEAVQAWSNERNEHVHDVDAINEQLSALTAALNELKAECDVSVHFCEKCGQADPLKTFDIASMIRAALAGIKEHEK